MSDLYPKIYSPFTRFTDGPRRNKLNIGSWAKDEFRILAGLGWEWTEKVDGTNIRIIWDGYKVRYGGRTDNAQIPATLIAVLDDLFPETLMEQQFAATPAILYGEGYGAKIQKGGGNYRKNGQWFVLFDVKIGHWWLRPEDVTDIATKLGVTRVPAFGNFDVGTAIRMVTDGVTSRWGDFAAEGLVGCPPLGLLGRDGDRLLMKIKTVDFR